MPSIRVRSNDLTLRSVTEADFDRLTEVYDSTFNISEQAPPSGPATIRTGLTRQLAESQTPTSRHEWTLWLAAENEDGAIVGTATLAPDTLPYGRRPLASTSWVIGSLRSTGKGTGNGIGTTIRHGVLTLAFNGLDADIAVSLIRPKNATSTAVTQKLGYVTDGSFRNFNVDGNQGSHDVWTLQREDWAPSAAPAELSGHEPLRHWLDRN